MLAGSRGRDGRGPHPPPQPLTPPAHTAMAHDYIPKRDAEFRDWSRSFSEQINANPEQFGLTPLLASEYAALNDAYAAALEAAFDRARPAIETKKTARKAAEKEARRLVRIIQVHPSTTNTMRAELRITVPDPELTPVAQPREMPLMIIVGVVGPTVRLRFRGMTEARRGKPEGVSGVTVLSYVGDEPPADPMQWAFHGSTSRLTYDATFHNVEAGTRVWLTAFWFNTRAESGPVCAPQMAFTQHNVTVGAMRLAA
jgi:hypothetical protein